LVYVGGALEMQIVRKVREKLAGGLKNFRTMSVRQKLISTVVWVVLIGLVVTLLLLLWSSNSKHKMGVVCSDAVLKQAALAFNANKTADEKKVAAQVLTLENYNQDPNCMYILVNYNINIGDAQTAGSYLTQLEKVYKPAQGFSVYFAGAYGRSYETLKDLVANLQKQQQDLKNGKGGGVQYFKSP
jgi:hypothetical protein